MVAGGSVVDEYPDEPCPECDIDEWMVGYLVYEDDDVECHKYFCFNCGFNVVVTKRRNATSG